MATIGTSSVRDVLQGAVASGAVPGAVAAVTGPDGAAGIFSAGVLEVGGDAAVTPDTMFRLMSMTKPFATVAALQLIEQGELSLHQQVASVLPQWGELKVLDGFDGDTPRLREPASAATIKQLLNHTAGHGYGFCNADLLRYHAVTGLPDPFTGKREGLLAPLIADPGTEWNYGINTDWLGQVIEAISGVDLAAYLNEHVFGPLAMTDTTFTPTDEQRSRMMGIHSRTPDGGLTPNPIEAPISNPEFWPGGHGAFGTAGDYARFAAALLGGGELDGARILRPDTVELAFSDHLDGIALPKLMKSAQPEVSNDVPAAPFRQGWGYGFHLFAEDLPGLRHAGTGDWAGLFNCYFWIDRSAGVASVFLTQVLPFYDARVIETALTLEAGICAPAAAEA